MVDTQLFDKIPNLSSEQAQLGSQVPIGVPYAFVQRSENVTERPNHLLVNTKDGILYIAELTVDSKETGQAVQQAAQAKLFAPPMQLDGVHEYDHG